MDKTFGMNLTYETGGTFPWYISDTEDQYNLNIEKRLDLMKRFGWYPNPGITYNVNNQGFRIDYDIEEKEHRDSIIVLGCSLTFGIGLNKDDIWPTIIEKDMGLPVYNLGVPGGGVETYFRLLFYWLPKLKSKYVLALGHPGSRREFYSIIEGWTLLFSNGIKMPFSFEGLNKRSDVINFLNAKEFYMVENRTINAIENVCRKNDSEFHYLSLNGITLDNQGRDLAHPGKDFQKDIAEKFKKLIEGKI